MVFFINDYYLKVSNIINVQMRSTRIMSVWPVAFVGGDIYASPVVTGGQVTGWLTRYKPERKFAVDMAMFAISVR